MIPIVRRDTVPLDEIMSPGTRKPVSKDDQENDLLVGCTLTKVAVGVSMLYTVQEGSNIHLFVYYSTDIYKHWAYGVQRNKIPVFKPVIIHRGANITATLW